MSASVKGQNLFEAKQDSFSSNLKIILKLKISKISIWYLWLKQSNTGPSHWETTSWAYCCQQSHSQTQPDFQGGKSVCKYGYLCTNCCA